MHRVLLAVGGTAPPSLWWMLCVEERAAGKLYELEVKYLVGGVARSMLGAQHVTD